MAELHVQPKKASNWWLWLLLGLIALAVIFFLLRGRDNTADSVAGTQNDTSSTSSSSSSSSSVAVTTPTTTTTPNGTGDIDFNAPQANYDEITDKDINVRGTDNFAIYSMGDNILFDVDKSTIRPDAQAKLKQIASSLNKRYADADIRIYGHADATGDAAHNKELSEQRAESVKNWIIKNASMKEDRISLYPEGEANPVATNSTEQGKQENRSVQIVAKKR